MFPHWSLEIFKSGPTTLLLRQELLDLGVRGAPSEEQRKKLAERVLWARNAET